VAWRMQMIYPPLSAANRVCYQKEEGCKSATCWSWLRQGKEETAQTTSTTDHVNTLSFETQGAGWVKTSRSLGGNKRGDRNYEFQN
jgi:hypothetical protein